MSYTPEQLREWAYRCHAELALQLHAHAAALEVNAKLRRHAEAMAEDLWCEQVQDPNSTYHAYRADFPKEGS